MLWLSKLAPSKTGYKKRIEAKKNPEQLSSGFF